MPKAKPKKKASKKAEKKVPLNIAEIMKAPILASLGALAMAQEGMEKIFDVIVEKGKVSEEEGSRLVEELKEKGAKGREDLHAKFEEGLSKVMEKCHLASYDDVQEIKKKLDLLAQKVEDLKAQRKEK